MNTPLLLRFTRHSLMPALMSCVFFVGLQAGCTNGNTDGGNAVKEEAKEVKKEAKGEVGKNGIKAKVFVDHMVQANFKADAPDLEVLEFHYGQAVEGPGGLQRSVEPGSGGLNGPSVGGETPVPDLVYVKWRDKRTGEFYEERVDMTTRLPTPERMIGTTIYFLVDQFENRLFIYWVPKVDLNDRSVGRRPEGVVPNGPGLTAHLDVKTLYPDNSPPKPRGEYPKKWVELWQLNPEGLIVR